MVGDPWGSAYYPVEAAPLVPLRPAHRILGLSGAELPKVLGRLGHDIIEELERDASERLA